jgi:hypothetical protein
VSDRTRCEECNEPFKTRGPEDGKRLAIFAVGMSGHNTACLLCAGSCGIPNAAGLAGSDATAARMGRPWWARDERSSQPQGEHSEHAHHSRGRSRSTQPARIHRGSHPHCTPTIALRGVRGSLAGGICC